jgi:hypothetical protein
MRIAPLSNLSRPNKMYNLAGYWEPNDFAAIPARIIGSFDLASGQDLPNTWWRVI